MQRFENAKQKQIQQILSTQSQKKNLVQTELKYKNLYLLKQKQKMENDRKAILKKVRQNKSNEGINKIEQFISSQNIQNSKEEKEITQEKTAQTKKISQPQQARRKKKRSSQSQLNGSEVKISDLKKIELEQQQEDQTKYKLINESDVLKRILNIGNQNEENQLKNPSVNQVQPDQNYQSTKTLKKEFNEIYASKEKENDIQQLNFDMKYSKFEKQLNQSKQQQYQEEEVKISKTDQIYQDNLISLECSRQNSGEEVEEEESGLTDKGVRPNQNFQIPSLFYQKSQNKKEQDLYNLYNGSKNNNSFYSYFSANPKESIFSFGRNSQNHGQEDQRQDNFLDSWKQTLQSNSLFSNPFYEPNALNELRESQDFEEEQVSKQQNKKYQEEEEEEKEPEWGNVDVKACDAKKYSYKKGYFTQK